MYTISTGAGFLPSTVTCLKVKGIMDMFLFPSYLGRGFLSVLWRPSNLPPIITVQWKMGTSPNSSWNLSKYNPFSHQKQSTMIFGERVDDFFFHTWLQVYKSSFQHQLQYTHFPWENVFFFGGVTSSESLETEFPPASGIPALKGMQSPGVVVGKRRIFEDGLLPGWGPEYVVNKSPMVIVRLRDPKDRVISPFQMAWKKWLK